MRSPTQLRDEPVHEVPEDPARIGRRQRSLTLVKPEIPAAGVDRTSSASPGDEIEAWARRALAANGFGEAAMDRTDPQQRATCSEFVPRARTPRLARLTRLAEAALRAMRNIVQRWVAERRRRRLTRETYLALRELDPHMLRDLGFDPSEIRSVAGEVAGLAEATRVRTVQALHGLSV